MATNSQPVSGVRTALARPFYIVSIVMVVLLVASLGYLVFRSWESAWRLHPLERHISHLQGLQDTSMDIQEIIIRHYQHGNEPTQTEVKQIRDQLQALLDAGNNLHKDTPEHLRQAIGFLDAPSGNLKAGLLASLGIVRKTLQEENALQQKIVRQTRQLAEAQFFLSVGALILVPLLAILLLVFVQRRAFASINRISNLLDNVGDLDFRPAEPPDPHDPFGPVFDRYNRMAQRLRDAAKEEQAHRGMLEQQVRTASETLIQQQAELENGARLTAVGEFSARMAHELRNPISGISVALHNLQTELENEDHRDRVGLVADEMQRVTKLLNMLLEQGRVEPELPRRVQTKALVNDIVRLFRYQIPPNIRIVTDVEDRSCRLPRDTTRQVLINLLRNASEAIGDADGEVRISMHRESENKSVLAISDSGPGFPEEMLKMGIRPFQSGKSNGTGLGLSTVQRLVHAVGGEIELTNNETGGARILVKLPCGE